MFGGKGARGGHGGAGSVSVRRNANWIQLLVVEGTATARMKPCRVVLTEDLQEADGKG